MSIFVDFSLQCSLVIPVHVVMVSIALVLVEIEFVYMSF